jgi:hypothetical protein
MLGRKGGYFNVSSFSQTTGYAVENILEWTYIICAKLLDKIFLCNRVGAG